MEDSGRPVAPCTRRQDSQLAEPVQNLELLKKGRTRGSRSVQENSSNKENRPLTRDENTQPGGDRLIRVMEQADAE